MHESFILRCLALAELGRGSTGINPMVGAVLVREGKIIAEGFHEAYGESHAERQLLEKLEQKIRSSDIFYVNLEPCCHTDKKTPPCAQFIVEKGIKHVVYGMKDPNPMVSGKGISFLRSQGVEVIGPVLPEVCARLNRGFTSLMTNGRPWITLKSARTVDGRTANPGGKRLMITSPQQDLWAHKFLRAKHDAILVGIGTILADDPELTVRHVDHQMQIYRIILDAELKIPLQAKVVNRESANRTVVVCEGTDGTKEKRVVLEKRGVRIVALSSQGGLFDWNGLWKALATPASDFFGITSILVEGGPKTWQTFRDSCLVDEEVTLVG